MAADEKAGASPWVISPALLPTSMGVLALIVIGFVAETWSEIDPSMRRHAFVVVNASGAHALFSSLFANPAAAMTRNSKGSQGALATLAGFFVYSYWALLIQHKGLTQILLDDKWESIFPFTDLVFPVLDAPGSQWLFYFAPLIFAWAAFVLVFALLLPLRLFARR